MPGVFAVSDELRILIPGNPAVKQRPRVNHNTGNVYTPKETKVAQQVLAWHFSSHMRRRAPLRGELEAVFTFAHSGAPTEGDWDNFGKLASDAGNRILYGDDRQLTLVTVDLRRHDPKPRTVVAIRQRST